MFTLKKENKAENIAAFLERAQSLRALEMIKRFEVVSNIAGTPDNNFDVAVVFDFENLEDLNAYQVSDIHVAFGGFVSTIRETRACIDYEI